MTSSLLDQKAWQRYYAALAPHYAQSAVIMREMHRRMLARFAYIRVTPRCILNLGSGFAADDLAARFPKAMIINVDFSLPLLRANPAIGKKFFARQAGLLANTPGIPLRDASVDLIYANGLWQWLPWPVAFAQSLYRVLKPGGLLMMTSLGVDSFKECRQAWQGVDNHAHSMVFPDMHDIGDALLGQGFADPVMDAENLRFHYRDLKHYLADIKKQGFGNCLQARCRHLMARQKWQTFLQRLAKEASNKPQRYALSIEVIYGHAWKPSGPAPRLEQNTGEVAIPLTAITRGKKKREQ